MNREKCTAVVLAAGKGSRMGTKIQKQYLEICGKPVLYYSLAAFAASPIIDEIVLVTGEGKTDYCRKNIIEAYGITKVNKIVVGGKERYEFFYNYASYFLLSIFAKKTAISFSSSFYVQVHYNVTD